jgi:hypothetical protein
MDSPDVAKPGEYYPLAFGMAAYLDWEGSLKFVPGQYRAVTVPIWSPRSGHSPVLAVSRPNVFLMGVS